MDVLKIDKNMQLPEGMDKSLHFYSAKDKKFGVFGLPFFATEKAWQRLERRQIEKMKPINEGLSYLATNPAGGQIHFQTNSETVQVYVELAAKSNMSHMPATGQCGIDCYLFDKTMGRYVLRSCTTYNMGDSAYVYTLYRGTTEANKFILNLPLYMGVKDIFIGLQKEAEVRSLAFANSGKILVYGTSIVQGGCASRPGMAHTNIISRALGQEVVNFGFSGTAFCEEEMGEICGSVEHVELLIVDAEPNAGIDMLMTKNLPKFLAAYRKQHLNVPILLISRIPFAMDLYNEYRRELMGFYQGYLKGLANTEKGVYFSDGSKYFDGDCYEYTVDGIHPTDYGFAKIADGYIRAIAEIRKSEVQKT